MPVVAKPYLPLSESAIEDFWANVQKGDGCWEWQAGRTGKNYGAFFYGGRVLTASRLAYVLTNGEVAPIVQVCHRCDNPPCCRPDHLYAGSHMDNVRDWVERDRLPHHRGAANCNAKLTTDQVREALLLHSQGMTGVELGRMFGLSQPSMAKLLRRESYREVDLVR